MKKLSLMALLIFFASCSTDDSHTTMQANPNSAHISKLPGVYPANADNEYDAAGRLHNEITEAYLASGNTFTSVANIISAIEVIANLNPTYLAMKPANYTSPLASRLEHIIDYPEDSAVHIISNSSLSANMAKGIIASAVVGVVVNKDYPPFRYFRPGALQFLQRLFLWFVLKGVYS